MPAPELLDSWVADLAALAPEVDAATAHAEGTGLLTRWSESHRRYHTTQHLTEMLTALDTLSAATGLGARDVHLTRVAAWLHDAVYDVQAAPGDSERASAELAGELLASLGIGASDLRLVEALIVLTIDHGTQLPGTLADTFTDADLAILAAPDGRFDEYCAQVRAEYAHVPDAAYATARSAILAALVDRPEVYRTAYARTSWTAAARRNVGRELDRLCPTLPPTGSQSTDRLT